MPDDSNILPLTRILRWSAIGVLICLGLALYFRSGRRVPPVTANTAEGTVTDSGL